MLLPIRTDSPLRSSPYVNWALIVLNVIMFVAQNLVGDDNRRDHWSHQLALWGSAPEMWQFVTYGFLHGGGLHLAGNMLFLYIFGNNVNDKMGHIGYLAFYLSSLVFAGVFWMVWDKSPAPVIGASGAVASIVGAYMILFPRARVTILVFFLLIGVFEIPSLWFVLLFFLKDVVGLSGDSQIAYSAHVGGTLFGFAVCSALLALNLLPRDQFDIVALIKQWHRRRQYRDAVNTGWNPYGAAGPAAASQSRGWVSPEPVAATPIDPRQREILELRARISDAISAHDLPAAARGYVELKVLDPQQVLSRQAQLDVANQLAQEQRYPQAAEAYEMFLRHYPKYEQVEQVELMLGVVLNRFLNQPARAKELFIRALAKLTDPRSIQMATTELQKAEASMSGSTTGVPNVGST